MDNFTQYKYDVRSFSYITQYQYDESIKNIQWYPAYDNQIKSRAEESVEEI